MIGGRRGARRDQTERKLQHRLREWRAVTWDRYPYECGSVPFCPGRYRTGSHPLACGKTRCYLCHHEKLLGFPRRQVEKQVAAGLSEL